MKISNSKKELARIISKNGGWRGEAESAAQCVGGEVSFWHDTAKKQRGEDWCGRCLGDCYDIRLIGVKLPNWHQTILSRAEYFHLYPATDSDGWIEWSGGECPVDKDARIDIRMTGGKTYYDTDTHWGWNADSFKITHYRLHNPEQDKLRFCESVMRSIPEPTAKPTIEQLAADYRNAKDYADFKQQEADDAKADADARLKTLELTSEDIGLLLSPITANKEPELVITDWRDLQAGDVISVSGKWWEPDSEYTVDENDGSRDAPIRVGNYWAFIGECSFKFIRRP